MAHMGGGNGGEARLTNPIDFKIRRIPQRYAAYPTDFAAVREVEIGPSRHFATKRKLVRFWGRSGHEPLGKINCIGRE
jgi:hypothetical protein